MDTPCIEWQGTLDDGGYGRAYSSRLKKTVKAHRKVFEDANGPIPDGMVIMHLCDNRKCINLTHLKLGTQGENLADMYAKGRQGLRCLPVGEAHHNTKLTNEQALEISLIARPGNYRALGRAFGVSRVTIRNIATGRTWSEVTGLRTA